MTTRTYRFLLSALSCPEQTNNCLLWHTLQDRPCTRCIHRNIGHLCHDEARETPTRKARSESDCAGLSDEPSKNELGKGQDMPVFPLQDESRRPFLQDGTIGLPPSTQGVPPGSNGSTTQAHGSGSATQPRELSQTG